MISLLAWTVVSPLIIAHRGASAERPEHTLAAYALAIEQGADYIEPDLVSTKDGVLVCRHENEISGTTDVAEKPEFASRKTTKTIDGEALTGWFTEDFTLAELQTLRAKERLPQLRPANRAFDGQFSIPTFAEAIQLAKSKGVGIYPETKHPGYFRRIGQALEPQLLADLRKVGWTSATDPVFIQSFETSNLRELRGLTKLNLIQLIDSTGKSADGVDYASMLTHPGLAKISEYANGIGPYKELVIPRVNGRLGTSTSLVSDAHRAGLKVHIWTFRPEPFFMASVGQAEYEIRRYLATGVDGIFSDSVPVAIEARKQYLADR